jgi:hypothetical protein
MRLEPESSRHITRLSTWIVLYQNPRQNRLHGCRGCRGSFRAPVDPRSFREPTDFRRRGRDLCGSPGPGWPSHGRLARRVLLGAAGPPRRGWSLAAPAGAAGPRGAAGRIGHGLFPAARPRGPPAGPSRIPASAAGCATRHAPRSTVRRASSSICSQ